MKLHAHAFESAGRRRGWAMVAVVLVIVAVSAALALMLTSSAAADRSANVTRHASAARFRAEGGLAAGQRALLEAVASWRPAPAGGMLVLDGVTVAYTLAPTGFESLETDATGIQTQRTRYRIESRAEVHGASETVRRVVDTLAVPIFQFAVFYTDDLEINPGPDMRLRGRIHTNGDLYLNSGGRLTLDSNYVHAVGNLYRERKDQPGVSQGTVDVREWVANPFDPAEPASYAALNSLAQMLAAGVVTDSGYDSAFTAGYDAEGDGDYFGPDDWLPFALGALEYWDAPAGYAGGADTPSTIQTSDHGLSAALTPGVGSIAAYEPAPGGGDFDLDPVSGEYVRVAAGSGAYQQGFFHGEAGLVLEAAADGNSWRAFDANGIDVSAYLTSAVTLADVYDARQGGDVRVLQIDVAALNTSGVFPPNGLVYAAGQGNATGTAARGVHLANGSELFAPLTVASDGPVYVQGDYNTVAKKGAAVIADAVNLLSNAWNDSKGASGLPSASETTFNLAFISGNHATTPGAYNGGFENLPRFHENWSGVPCHITGSFVNAWESQHATGTWVYGGNRYTAPRRDFAYDPAFNDAANLPPYTPLVVTGADVVTW
jgi:hypothetical protein